MVVKPFEEVDKTSDLAQGNGKSRFQEIGTSGAQAWSGFLRQAYHAELRWPEVFPLFDRIRRSDPEVSIVRGVFNSLGRSITLNWQLPEDPSEDDERAQEFGYEVFDDLEGGIERWRDAVLAYVPFHGWGWWEIVPAVRLESWRPPGGDPWRSNYNDGRLGVRKLAWRDHSSFYSWDMDDATGRLMGFNQMDIPNPPVTIPLDRSVHIIYGDTESPEGLSPLEAVWRLERIKYGLELIHGIGFEHAAGYLDVTSEKAKLSPDDLAAIRTAARSIMSVQEGNYAAWPKGLEGELKDVNFQAAGSLLEAIRYYGILKLQIYAMSWVAMASTAKTGAFSAVQDISGMFIKIYNAMVEGFTQQLDDQFGRRLFEMNASAFPGMTERPKIVATLIDKNLGLAELGTFSTAFANLFPMGEEDVLAIRRRSGFLPEILPEPEDDMTKEPEIPEPDEPEEEEVETEEGEEPEEEESEEGEEPEEEDKEMALRPFVVPEDERPLDVTYLAPVDDAYVRKALNAFNRWAKKNDPKMAEWMDAEILEEEES